MLYILYTRFVTTKQELFITSSWYKEDCCLISIVPQFKPVMVKDPPKIRKDGGNGSVPPPSSVSSEANV